MSVLHYRMKSVLCVDVAGICRICLPSYVSCIPLYYLTGQRVIKLILCGCHNEVEALTKLKLFPATPKKPAVVFTYCFLDWMEALTLECQVACKDFISSFQVFNQNNEKHVYDMWTICML